MAYRITKGDVTYEADCIYDFNHLLPIPHAEPADGDWHALDNEIEEALTAMGWDVYESH